MPDYTDIDAALRRAGAAADAPDAHGLLCSLLCIHSQDAFSVWITQVMEGVPPGNAPGAACEALLKELFTVTGTQLDEGLLEFSLLLPPDTAPMSERTDALANWAQAFLSGFAIAGRSNSLTELISTEPLDELLADIAEITRVSHDTDLDDDENEIAFEHVTEYLRIALQTCFEELRGFRASQSLVTDELN